MMGRVRSLTGYDLLHSQAVPPEPPPWSPPGEPRSAGGSGRPIFGMASFPDGEAMSEAVLAARDGDDTAFGLLYRAVQPRILRYLRLLVGPEAEDVASEAWLHIARDLPSFDGDFAGFRAWAVTVARHRALDHLRYERRHPIRPAPDETFADVPARDDPAGEAVEAVSTDAALVLVATLPRDQAEAVMLRVVLGLDAQSAARVLGKRPGAVRIAAMRGLRRLAEQLDPHSIRRAADEV
jgi:RNA polymerase sigma-70 factor (ECF subfamily)